MLAAVLAVAACATTGAGQTLVYMVAVQQGTSRFIEHKETAPERSARALEVIRVIGDLKGAITDEEVTINALQTRALQLIAQAGLREPSDQALANTLVAAVSEALRAKISDGVLKPDDRVRVASILDQIAAAARVYVQDAPTG